MKVLKFDRKNDCLSFEESVKKVLLTIPENIVKMPVSSLAIIAMTEEDKGSITYCLDTSPAQEVVYLCEDLKNCILNQVENIG